MAISATYGQQFETQTVKSTKKSNTKTPPHAAQAFGIEFPSSSLKAMAWRLVRDAVKGRKARVAFVNAHCINEMYRSQPYNKAVRTADVILPDGSGMALATKLISGSACNNLNGTDLAPALFEAAQAKGLSVFFLGARPGVAHRVCGNMKQLFPRLKIAGAHHGYFTEQENDAVITSINAAKPDIVLVAFGVPKQDVWLAENAHRISANITMGVGGLFDFLSGRIPRAPIFLRKTGLEWTYRLYQEPARMWRRYILGNPVFVARAVVDALSKRGATVRRLVDKIARRVLDIAGASAGLICLAPIFAAATLAIKLESRGPTIFKQQRIGKDGAPFTMYKFRSMVKDAEARKSNLTNANHHGKNGVTFKMSNDPRITPVGKFIRKYSIDELPQLWNVLVGDMSLVGPRPALPPEVAQYNNEERKRLAVKPGITCIWQITGRADIDFKGQVALDIQYINQQSFFQDIIILIKTPIAVLTARGAY